MGRGRSVHAWAGLPCILDVFLRGLGVGGGGFSCEQFSELTAQRTNMPAGKEMTCNAKRKMASYTRIAEDFHLCCAILLY